ncbi:MAG TPA: hypothetical protein VFG72_03095 [Marmoricola sp.]|nr:hypothetical protein [Marmoricola sp.]
MVHRSVQAAAVLSLLAGPLVAAPVASAEVAQELAAEPAVASVQRIEPLVVLRPLDGSRLSAKGNDLSQISAVGSHDVPEAALRAYRNAASTIARTDPACQLPWTLLAGIGRVESDHGRYGGSQLDSEGVSHPAIRGVALNGVGPVAAIPDSDDGRFDNDVVWDRAVGPMQFIPDTWRWAGRDGDGDGVATPNDLDDAALAAAAYLCPASGSVLPESSMRAAIFGYNHSDYYVDLVMAFERGYRTGDFVIPAPPAPEVEEPEKPETKKERDATAAPKPDKPKPESKPNPKAPRDPKDSKPGPSKPGGPKGPKNPKDPKGPKNPEDPKDEPPTEDTTPGEELPDEPPADETGPGTAG